MGSEKYTAEELDAARALAQLRVMGVNTNHAIYSDQVQERLMHEFKSTLARQLFVTNVRMDPKAEFERINQELDELEQLRNEVIARYFKQDLDAVAEEMYIPAGQEQQYPANERFEVYAYPDEVIFIDRETNLQIEIPRQAVLTANFDVVRFVQEHLEIWRGYLEDEGRSEAE
jgi:hypothetical protein